MKATSLIIIALLSAPIPSNAGFFGPNNYEECVLDNMKGVTSDQAARAIQQACREKFPVQVKEKIVRNKNEFPGFPFDENAFGANILLNRYIMNYDEIKIFYKTPEDYVFAVFKDVKEKKPNRRYEDWANEHNINYFIVKANEFDEYMTEK
jgi:hypothetical protein